MKKFKFVGLFIAAGLLMQSAYAACSVPARPTGGQACMQKGSGGMYVYTCQSNGTWVTTGSKCNCPESGVQVITESSSGTSIMYCLVAYTTSQANTNMSYASNRFSKSAQ